MGRKFTIGFIDEYSYDEYHNRIVQGMLESARRHDINIIRFGHFSVDIPSSNVSEEDILIEFIRQFKLDGLIFLGWARVASNKSFRERFENMPMVSFGSHHEGIPSVFFRGSNYIRELLHHLVQSHKYNRIAFIYPFRPDVRSDVYRETMEGYGYYDPDLCVTDGELRGLSVAERGRRAVEILLDERKVKIDAIVSLYNEETYEVIRALNDRGMKVPGDIAVTSYEEGEVSRLLAPGITTVYFPWWELGYYACEAMYRLLTKGDIPMRSEVSGKIIYRRSCGCIPHLSGIPDREGIIAPEKAFENLDDIDFEAASQILAENTVFTQIEALELLRSLKHAFNAGSEHSFLSGFEILLRKIEYFSDYEDFEKIAFVFRETLLPYFLPYAAKEVQKLVWVEDLFQQMQMMLQDKIVYAGFLENLEYNNIKLAMKDAGQIIVTNFNMEGLKDSIAANLPRLGVRNLFLYLFSGEDDRRPFEDYRLELEYRGGQMIKADHVRRKNEVSDFESYLFSEDRSYMYLAHLLHFGNDYIGFILTDPTQLDIRIYRNLSVQIVYALNGIMLFEKLDSSYRQLMEQAHRRGMADTTGILHNIANILNSVNVTTQSIESLMAGSAVNDLLMANSLLEQNIGDLEKFVLTNPKGKILMQYYVNLGSEFDIFRGKLQTYIGRLADKVSLIEGIVNAQQSYTDVKSSLERLDVVPVIEDVLNMYQTAIERRGAEVERNYESSVIAMAQRTKLFHVLTNIVKNGIESMEKTEPGSRILTVAVYKKDLSIFISISDSGEGIAEGNLEHIFAYGFTTKKDGHGFGLHSCANYMTEMKGRIWAENKTIGRGATFVLQLTAPSGT
ncbi:MAG TPA: substrate-binding domain-containing protein [Clostridia bacterium]|nr:substrate-binding domain-containing protein [Clostridia bacterium]